MRFQSIKTELNRTVHPKPNRTKPLKKLELEPNRTDLTAKLRFRSVQTEPLLIVTLRETKRES